MAGRFHTFVPSKTLGNNASRMQLFPSLLTSPASSPRHFLCQTALAQPPCQRHHSTVLDVNPQRSGLQKNAADNIFSSGVKQRESHASLSPFVVYVMNDSKLFFVTL
jgi:hypothetical protein